MKKILFGFLTLVLGFMFCFSFSQVNVAEGAGWAPEVDIPFQGEGSIKGVEQTPTSYIDRVYKFVTMMIGIMAAVMFMIGGFQYITSAGNNAASAEAKKTMFAALAGMIIVLGAYLLLRIINLELVDLRDPITMIGIW